MLAQRPYAQEVAVYHHRDLKLKKSIDSECSVRQAASHAYVERAVQRLQELDVEKREPILLRCSALQHARAVKVDTLQRTSPIYKISYEFHGAVSQSLFRLVPSLETDEWPVRYVFASMSGRSTHVHLRSSAVYTAHWHVISPTKEVQVKRRAVSQLSYELILRPMEIQTAERWHMNWEYVVYRVSHGVHFAVMQCVADISPQQSAVYIRVQKAYPRRYVRTVTAPIQKKKMLKASEAYPIAMSTVDRGEPCYVKSINIVEYRRYMADNQQLPTVCAHKCSSNNDPELIKCNCCCGIID